MLTRAPSQPPAPASMNDADGAVEGAWRGTEGVSSLFPLQGLMSTESRARINSSKGPSSLQRLPSLDPPLTLTLTPSLP